MTVVESWSEQRQRTGLLRRTFAFVPINVVDLTRGALIGAPRIRGILQILLGRLTSRASTASEPREWSAPATRRAKERVGESEGRSLSEKRASDTP